MNRILLLTGAGLALLLASWLAGCGDAGATDEEGNAARPQSEERQAHHAEDEHADHADHADHEGHHGGHQHDPHGTRSGADDDRTVDTGQKTCPVMGHPVNPEIFVEHEGRKVYFCCRQCIPEFEADPDRFLAQLDREMQ